MEKIEKKNIQNILAVTPVQEGLLFHFLKEPQSDFYHEQLCLFLAGSIKKNCFEKAWHKVRESNEMLRTTFRWEGLENPVQVILNTDDWRPEFYDFRGKSHEQIEALVENVKIEDRKKVAALHGNVPFRVSLCRTSKNDYVMIISNHHILYDGWSNGIILKEFFDTYADLAALNPPMSQLKTKFQEYVQWLQHQDKTKQELYWRNYLSGFDTQTELSLKKKNRGLLNSKTLQCSLNEDIKIELERFSGGRQITPASLFYCAWGILLQKYNNNGDVLFGITVSGRPAQIKGIEKMVGLFIHTLPLRVECHPDEKIENLITEINHALRQMETAGANFAPLVDIKRYSELEGIEELFDSLVVIENYPLDHIIADKKGPLAVNSYSILEKTHYDLTLGVTISTGIELSFIYNEGVLANEIMVNLAHHFQKVLINIIKTPETRISQIEIISPGEKQLLLYDFNKTETAYPADKTIPQLFIEQAAQTPDHIALVGAVQLEQITYRQLNEQSDQVAALLIEKGVLPDSIVGIMMERSVEMLTAILGILKSGGAYLPIDPGYPEERIDYMLKDSGAAILLTDFEKEKMNNCQCSIVNIQLSMKVPQAPFLHHSAFSIQHSNHLCYIIYTSGTTGRPKGVMVEHRNAINTVTWFAGQYHIKTGIRVLQSTEYTFDPSVEQTFGTLLHGGMLCLVNKEMIGNLMGLRDFIDRHQVQIINSVPMLLKELLENSPKLKSLRAVLSGGDKLTEPVKDSILNSGYNLYNHYGPTEITVDALTAKCTPGPVVLGKPIANTVCYIMGSRGEYMPVGAPGELITGGAGTARGYLNNPELTSERFDQDKSGVLRTNFHHSAFELPRILHSNLYCTGDLARWLPAGPPAGGDSGGVIEFLGRIDQQVKIRGFRIELHEIEARLSAHPLIDDAVVIAIDNENQEKYLCAYFVSVPTAEVDALTLKEFLARELPHYMIPGHFIRLNKIPLTINGKIDRKALPIPTIQERKTYKAPRNDLEKKLTILWAGVLGKNHDNIGIDDNFFESGGHSLLAIRLAARIHKNLHVVVSVSQLFKFPTVRELAIHIGKAGGETYTDIAIAILAVEKKEYYPVSPAQKRLYILQKGDNNSTNYNMTQFLQLVGKIDAGKLEKTFHQLIRRHESFRTSFGMVSGQVVQWIQDTVEFEITKVFGPTFIQKGGPPEAILKSFIQPFDPAKAPLLRVGLITENEQQHILMIDMHHIISDGISTGIMIKDFMSLWAGEELPPLAVQYKDFSQWQYSCWQREMIINRQNYWLDRFAGDIPALELPLDFMRPSVQHIGGKRLSFEMEAAPLQHLASRHEVTLHMVLAALISVFLAKISNCEDIVIGTPTIGRRHQDLENIIGMFVNTLAIRYNPIGEYPFKAYLQNVKEITLEAFENQDYPFEELVEKLAVARVPGRNPLFDVMFALQDLDIPAMQIPGLTVTPRDFDPGTAKFDLTFICHKLNDNLVFSIEYAAKLFKEETIERFTGYFKQMVADVIQEPGKRIAGIELINREEKQEILIAFNNTETNYPADRTIHQLFVEQAVKTPDRVAVFGDGHVSLTYRQLNERSGFLAELLIEKCVRPDSIVAIMMERSIEQIIGILGILKSGGAYLPIDPGYPEERIDYMLKDSGAILLAIANDQEGEKVRRWEGERVLSESIINSSNHLFYQHSAFELPSIQHSNFSDLAYIIYTSGSTGKPKGNLTTHANVIRVVRNTNYIELTRNDRILQLSNYAFDGSVFDIFGALLNGAALIMMSKETVTVLDRLAALILKEQVTVFFVTTALFNTIIDLELNCLRNIRKVLFGGEKVSVEHARKALAYLGKSKIIHVYGPTETTVYASYYFIDEIPNEALTIPIGRPLANTSIYIVDKYFEPVPLGIAGEIYIGGPGVARGYLNNPELTCERFIIPSTTRGAFKKAPLDPAKLLFKYHSPLTTHHSPLYKTGDLARWLPDGNVEFLGRIDHQIKLRGFRVELNEIENELIKHKNIKETVVVLKEKDAQKYLCAYFVAAEGTTLNISGLRAYLSKNLPNYMIPSYFIQLDKIPLNLNGKIDRARLPEPGVLPGEKYEAPRNAIEEKLVDIWSEVLKVEPNTIGIDDNFFELGGHSLIATLVMSRIQSSFSVQITAADLFRNPFIRQLAQIIEKAETFQSKTIEPAEKKEYYILSSSQKRLYIIQQANLDDVTYNMPLMRILEGDLDKERLEKTFHGLIEVHESFRTSFRMIDGRVMQRIHDYVPFEIEFDRGATPWSPEKSFIRPFDLLNAPLLRVGLLKLDEKKYLLMIDMHHIISDGISMKVFIEDFISIYTNPGKTISPLCWQYKDFSEWQNSKKTKEIIKIQEEYWLSQFYEPAPELKLIYDYPVPSRRDSQGNRFDFRLNQEQMEIVKRMTREEGVTLFMLLQAIYFILLHKLSGNEDIVVGTPVTGREHIEFLPIIGMFVNTLALRNSPAAHKNFKDFLKEVKHRTLAAFDNQAYPFEMLVEKTGTGLDNPLFDTMFVLQDPDVPPVEISGLIVKYFDYKHPVARFDWTFMVTEETGTLLFEIEYRSHLFKESTIERLAKYTGEIIRRLDEDKNIKLKNIDLLLPGEKQQLLFEFNQTLTDYPWDKTIHQLFNEQVSKTPDQISLVGAVQVEQITYRRLNEQSDQVAALLIGKGVLPDSIVGIMMERSVEMITTILGILKSGGAYLPIEPDYPRERIDYMLKDSGAILLAIANDQEGEKVRRWEGERVFLESIINSSNHFFYQHSAFELPRIQHSNFSNLAYIIYTSGTTGGPKGVMVNHRNVVRLVKNTGYIEFKKGNRLLQTGVLAFDASTFEIWGTLLNGLELYLAEKEILLTPIKLKETMIKYDISLLWMTSSLFNRMVDAGIEIFSSLKDLLVGGEALSPRHINQLRKKFPRLRIINGYGPTENTTFSTTFVIDKDYDAGIPIGKPIANSTAYIVDKWNHLVPIGVAGELWVGGDGVSRGYMNNPELTAERFDQDLWDKNDDQDKKNKSFFRGSRGAVFSKKAPLVYRTGDLVRWLPCGNIEYLGRIDQQVKIRGFRIEPSEIANRLLRSPHVKDTVVITRQYQNGEKYLCAYIVGIVPPSISQADFIASLKKHLANELPGYMIPQHFVLLEKVPLTPNGKVDHKALPIPSVDLKKEYIKPRDEFEKKLIELWAEILNVPHTAIGSDDNFFQLGGHSLNVSILVSRIHKVFHVEMPISEAFKRPIAGAMAEYIRQANYKRYDRIEPVEKREYYDLSSAQKRLYVLHQMAPESIAYNMTLALNIHKRIDKNVFENAFQKLIARHESLRTCFIEVNDTPVQKVYGPEEIHFEVEYYDLAAGGTGNKVKTLIRPFDLSRAPLIRSIIIKSTAEYDTWILDIHHIISDGTSHAILFTDFMVFFERDGKGIVPLEVQYKDYSHWQNRVQQSGKLKAQEDYWLKLFADAGEIPRLNLPADYNRPSNFTFAGSQYRFTLGKEISAGFKAQSIQYGSTLYMNFLAALNTLFYKYTGQLDIIIGVGSANRNHADLYHVIGMFVNMLGMRNYPRGEMPYDLFLKEVIQNSIQAFENQDIQFETLIDRLELRRDPSRNPLFDVSMIVQNFKPPVIQKNDELQLKEFTNSTAKFDMTFFIEDQDAGLLIDIEYYTGIFKLDNIERLSRHFRKIVETVITNPHIKIKDIEIISQVEKEKLLILFNDTAGEYPADKPAHQLFQEQVSKKPDSIAIFGHAEKKEEKNSVVETLRATSLHNQITYRQLNGQSDRLAQYLFQVQNVQPDDRVGILMDKTIDSIAVILGILKAGGAYVPLEPSLPLERLKYIISDAGICIVISQEKYSGILNQLRDRYPCLYTFICLDNWEICRSAINVKILPGNIAYVIYTSGTTGRPKGVMIEHRGMANLKTFFETALKVEESDRVLQFAKFSFDASVWEIFMALFNGALLYLTPEEVAGNYNEFEKFIERYQITVATLPPPYLIYLNPMNIHSLKKLVTAGSETSPALVDTWRRKLDYINAYGPTETTICATCWHAPAGSEEFVYQSVPIGKPILNTGVYILAAYDREQVQPLGVPGELCIAGVSLARGYLNNPELTSERFDHDLWDKNDDQDKKNKSFFRGSRGAVFSKKAPLVYKTGDLARWLPDGIIEFLGRIDQQVKIRGFRIELGEIENRLVKCPDIRDAVVIAKSDENGDKYLCAYFVSGKEMEIPVLREILARDLPDYMIPAYFMRLDKMPLNTSGKIDRKALPQPCLERAGNYTAPRDEIEKQLLTLWLDILGKDRLIGVTDNFFEVGGHSLRATILTSRIQKELNVKVPLAEVFKSPTIEGLARYIRAAVKETYLAIEPAEKKEYYPLSSAQGRFYILQEITPESTAYNMTSAYEVEGLLVKEKFETSLRLLIKRHAIFRTYFLTISGKPVQRVHEQVEFEIEYHNFHAGAGGENGQTRAFLHNFIRPFELSRAPLLRVTLSEISLNKHILLFDMHHIICDGTSMSIFLAEFMSLYAGGKPSPLKLHYHDFAQWQHNQLTTGKLEKQRQYWLQRFPGELPVLNMPTDFPRPPMQSFDGDKFAFKLEKNITSALKKVSRETGATLYMALLTIYNIVLARYTGQEDIIIGTTIAGRHNTDLQGIMGLLIETLVQRNYPMGHLEFKTFLEMVKNETLETHENQAYPFREIIRLVGADNEVSRNPVFDVMLIVQNFEAAEFYLEGLKFSSYLPREEDIHKTSKVDFTIEAIEDRDSGEIYFTLEYCTRLYKRETMERFARHFLNIISQTSANPLIPLAAIEVLNEAEKKQLLETFNDTTHKSSKEIPRIVAARFQDQAVKEPDRIAIVGIGQFVNSTVYLTYRGLHERAANLAGILIEKGVRPETIVALMIESSIEMAVAIWGILKAGGAYLPIEPGAPADRIDYMLKDSGAILLAIANDQEGEKVRRWEGERVLLESIINSSNHLFYQHSAFELPCIQHSNHLCYVIYTSGTSGHPKGVMVEHGNLANYIVAVSNEIGLREDDTVLQQGSLVFDAFVEEFYPLLVIGGKVAIPGKMITRDIPVLCQFIARHYVSMIASAPQMVNELNKALRDGLPAPLNARRLLSSMRIVLVGGDRVKTDYIDKFLEQADVYNTYGPTESTVCATYYKCNEAPGLSGDVPIGKPLAKYKIYIEDKYGSLAPIGVGGELCVGGPGVARGYMNNPELTSERFDQDLWDKNDDQDRKNKSFFRGSRGAVFSKKAPLVYKTGDLARWLPAGPPAGGDSGGVIEFLGRIDRQVKIRGYRIELAEIETLLTSLANIKEAVVIDETRKSGDKYLAAYVVSKETFDAGEIKGQLARQLPDYMIPTYIIKVEQIPWTSIGKVDRKRLPRPTEVIDSQQTYIAPGNDTEKRLAEIWQQILEKDRVGIDDNFFDIGGTSLDIIKLNTRIKEEFKKQISVVSLFQYTTIRTLTQLLEEEKSGTVSQEKQKEGIILDAIKRGQAKFKGHIQRQVERSGLEIAVIGMAGIFPGARNLEEFWENLKNGVESIHFFSEEELIEDGVDKEMLENPNYIKAKGIITGVEYFDASFFGYTPLEAQIMDPQMRIFQQTAWHALEDAGYDPFAYNRRIGLYAGASPNYYWTALTLFAGMGRNVSGFMAAQLADKDFMCTHTSYKFNLKGPSVSLQTACSTSLVAIHYAVQGLLHGECEIALAGGVSVSYPNKRGYIYQPGMIFSSDGHNRSFDARGDGSLFGDGVGVVVLKSLADAIADRDHIYALIKGSAINNDGLRKVGYTAPGIQGQMEVIHAAQSMAEVEPESITYIEAHGTATPLGDSVEIEALKQAFNTNKKRFCAVGTLKSNMGHLYSAAGAAGLIKTVLCLKHRLIPPSLHFESPNPQIDFQNSPFYVNTTLQAWHNDRYPLRAGVSSFGIGGTNAHVVLEEWPGKDNRGESAEREEKKLKLLLISARTPSALNKMTDNLVQYLKENPAANLADVAYTLQVGRKHFPYRRMMVSPDLEPGQDFGQLAQMAQRAPIVQAKEENRPIIFMFCGQGSQYEGMGSDLYQNEPVFRRELDQCFEILTPLVGYDLKEVLYPSGSNKSYGSYRINTIDQTEIAQPVLFAFEYALAKLLISWGIRPTAMIGYSFGEYVAACLAGVFSTAEVLEMIVTRGQLVQQTPVGKMSSVTLPEQELRPLLTKGVSIAIVNGPTCIVSGKKEDVEAFEKEMKQRRMICVPLNMAHAVHSPVMNPIRREFENKISRFNLNKPRIPFISNVTAQWVTGSEVTTPAYWGDHLCSTVRFSDGLSELLKQENAIFIEIGPGRILGMMIRVHAGKKPGHLIFNTVKHPQENAADDFFLFEKLGQLWQQGQAIDWPGFYGSEKRHRVSLPGYPFEGKRYWIEPKDIAFGSDSKGLTMPVPAQETKIDRVDEKDRHIDNEAAAPRNEIEHAIARLWKEFMGLDSVDINDDFFQLNGSSLVATQIIARLMQEYQIEIPMNRFYEHPTIAHLGELVGSLKKN